MGYLATKFRDNGQSIFNAPLSHVYSLLDSRVFNTCFPRPLSNRLGFSIESKKMSWFFIWKFFYRLCKEYRFG